MIKYKHSSNVVYSCKYHLVWCPKYRRKVLVDEVAARLTAVIEQVASKEGVEILELEIMPDHVHLLVEIPPACGVHRFVKSVKGTSSSVLRKEFLPLTTKLPTLWSNSYFVSTVGGVPLDAIKEYIQDQKTSQR